MPRFVNLVIIVAAMAAAAGGVVLFLQDGDSGEPVRILPPPSVSTETNHVETESKAYVTGAVRQPGLYAIEDDDRLADLIDLAGGATEEADLRAVNLAVRVKDQDHWTVPTIGESLAVPSKAGPVELPRGKVDINSADAELLETLPGYRRDAGAGDHPVPRGARPVQGVDDIVAVPGIGSATLEGLRDLVEVR